MRKDFNTFFNSSSIKHISYNWSATEIGKKHPSLSVGWCIRDQGQLDLFAGKSRVILQTDGTTLIKGKDLALLQERISLKVSDIKNFAINGKYINTDIFYKDKLPIFKDTNISFIGPDTYVQNNDGSIGMIVNKKEFKDAVDLKSLFITNSGRTQESQTLQVYKEMINGF